VELHGIFCRPIPVIVRVHISTTMTASSITKQQNAPTEVPVHKINFLYKLYLASVSHRNMQCFKWFPCMTIYCLVKPVYLTNISEAHMGELLSQPCFIW